MNTPTKVGFYWAKWRIAEGTELKTEDLSGEWETVEVYSDAVGTDTDPKQFKVFLCGIAESQPMENFFWGTDPHPLSPPPPRSKAKT